MTRSSQPLATFCAARFTASSPDAQKRLICMPATRKSQPAFSTAVLAITEPCSPIGETHAHDHVVERGRIEVQALLQPDSRPASRSPA